MNVLLYFRIFTIFALMTSGVLEVLDIALLETPIEQIGASAAVGMVSVSVTVIAKLIHII